MNKAERRQGYYSTSNGTRMALLGLAPASVPCNDTLQWAAKMLLSTQLHSIKEILVVCVAFVG